MSVIHDPAVRAAIEARIRQLTRTTRGRWGKMSVDQMLWHVNKAMAVAMGVEKVTQDRAPIPRSWIKFAVLRMPWTRNAPTNPGFVPKSEHDFETERARCLWLIEQMVERPIAGVWDDHPMFGKMTGRDVSQLTAKHLNHHLSQFGV
jgi:hypothetical protein